jgi:hypothetical protein
MLVGFLLLVGSCGLFTVFADHIGDDVLRGLTGPCRPGANRPGRD